MRKDILMVALLWVALTAAGEALAVVWQPMPGAAAEEAVIVDQAFRTLLILAVPVFAFVVAMLLYSVLRFRSKGQPAQDGPPIHSRRWVVATWLAVTVGLTLLMIAHPGLTGMAELAARSEKEADLVVKLEALRFAWKITYPEQKVSTFKELVLPMGKHVKFEVTSLDVLHSFWVPAFRMKIDAVPGMVTTTYATPDKTGGFQENPNLRLQCAELCGVGHGVMTLPVRVLEQGEFDTWVAQQSQK